MDDFIRLVGPNRAVEIGGVKLVRVTAENGGNSCSRPHTLKIADLGGPSGPRCNAAICSPRTTCSRGCTG